MASTHARAGPQVEFVDHWAGTAWQQPRAGALGCAVPNDCAHLPQQIHILIPENQRSNARGVAKELVCMP